MKLQRAAIVSIFALLSGVVIAKNVFNPQFTDEQLQQAQLELEDKEFHLGKREAKNVIDLNAIVTKGQDFEKRESKNVFSASLIVDERSLFKRDAKNVFDFDLVINDANLGKRDGKNVFDINMVLDDDKPFEKRDAFAKNVVNVHLIIDDESSLVKRGIENVINIDLALPEYNEYLKMLKDTANVGFIIGSDEYVSGKVEKVDNTLNISLKHDPKGCHGKKKKLNLESLSEVIDTFKDKMFDPTLEAKDKFVIPKGMEDDSENLRNTVLEPVGGDIATALVTKSELGLFAKYLRDSPSLYRKCETVTTEGEATPKPNARVIIFAPSNDAITQLPKKPWQFPEDIANAKSEDEQDTMIERNIADFVESHFVETEDAMPSLDSKSAEFKTFNNKEIVLRNVDGDFKVKMKDSEIWVNVVDVEILSNGALLTIDHTLV